MAKRFLEQKALALRREGKSYSQIKRELGVSKSTLSKWLRKFPLSKEQISFLRDKNEVRIEKFRQTMKIKKETVLHKYYKEEKVKILPFTEKELFIAGLFLYWGEGNKSLKGPVSINNTDPDVLLFMLRWLLQALHVPTDKIKVNIHLYSDMDKEEALMYWSQLLRIPRSQFLRPYVKSSTREQINHKGYGHGTCGLVVNNTQLKEKVMMGIKAIGDNYRTSV